MSEKGSVLILEDEIPLRELICTILHNQGYVPHGVGTLSEARSLIDKISFKAAVLDYNVTDGYGTEIISLLRERNPSIRVIGISARDNKTHFYQSGADLFLQKPFLPSQLMIAIEGIY